MNGDEETSPPSNLQVTDLDSKSLDEGEEPSAAASAAVTEDEPDELQDEQKSSDERPEGRPAQLDISAANMNGDTEPPVSASPSAPVTPGGSDKVNNHPYLHPVMMSVLAYYISSLSVTQCHIAQLQYLLSSFLTP